MKKTIYILFLTLLSVIPASSQVPNMTYNHSQETSLDAMRQRIGLDYSMPDYDTMSLDPTVIGPRLARILEHLKTSYDQIFYNRLLSEIRDEQITDRRAYSCRIHELEIRRVSKKGNVITINIATVSKLDKKQKCRNDISLLFVNGVSESMSTNELFSQLAKYIK